MIPVVVFVLAASAGASLAPPSDDEIRQQIEEEMSEDDLIDVKVSVKNLAVTLSGTVPSPSAAQRAMQRALHVAEDADETAKVVSRLKVSDAPADDALAEAVTAAIRAYGLFAVFDSVDVAARDGVVTLQGVVTSGEKVREIADRAGRVPGAREVVNRIEMLSPGALDDDLRLRIAGAIYDDAVFARYAATAETPVHVVVERGHVTLTGVVPSEIERAKAEKVARAVAGHFSVENRLRVEK